MVAILKEDEELLWGMRDLRKKREIERSEEEFLAIFKIRDSYEAHKQLMNFKKDPKNIRNLQLGYTLRVNEELLKSYSGAKLSIYLPLEEIKSSYKPIACKGTIGKTEVDILVACGHWHKLNYTPEELKTGVFNLIDHLHELIPSKGKTIGLITFQNGIKNFLEDFRLMGEAILANIPEGTLAIGLYNPTKGLRADLGGVYDKLLHNLCNTACCTYSMMVFLADYLSKFNRDLYWVHVAHSEGGIIAKMALSLIHNSLTTREKFSRYFKEQVIVATYGAVLPVEKTHGFLVLNTYSSKDQATLPRVKYYLESLGEKAKDYYKIKIEESIDTPAIYPGEMPELSVYTWDEMSMADQERYKKYLNSKALWHSLHFVLKAILSPIKGDHDFQGKTYQKVLKEDIEYFRDKHKGFYNAKKMD